MLLNDLQQYLQESNTKLDATDLSMQIVLLSAAPLKSDVEIAQIHDLPAKRLILSNFDV